MRVRISRRAGMMMVGVVLAGAMAASAGRGDLGLPTWRETLTLLAAAFLHEAGHVAAAWGWSVPVRSLRLDLFGARLELGGLTGYAAELAVAAGGPLVSLVGAALAYPLGGAEEGAALFSAVSLGLGLLNLLPVAGLDGGRMLACALGLTAGERAAEVTLRVTSAVALGSLWLLSVYALLRIGETLTLFTFSLCLLLRLTDLQK